RDGLACFVHVVERRVRAAVPRGALRFSFLQPGGVREQDTEQVSRSGSGVDRAVAALRDEARQQPAVIEVRVRQDDAAQFRRIERKCLLVEAPCLAIALEETAIDEERSSRRFEQEAGPGDLARRAAELELHRRMVPWRTTRRRCFASAK